MYARNTPAVEGAQWTGIVTQIALNMLESGAVDAVVCVQSADGDRFEPKPVRPPCLCPFPITHRVTEECDKLQLRGTQLELGADNFLHGFPTEVKLMYVELDCSTQALGL